MSFYGVLSICARNAGHMGSLGKNWSHETLAYISADLGTNFPLYPLQPLYTKSQVLPLVFLAGFQYIYIFLETVLFSDFMR